MGRVRLAKNSSLPPRLHLKRSSYFYVTTTSPRRWIPLGSDLSVARLEWARLENSNYPPQGKSPSSSSLSIKEVGEVYFDSCSSSLAVRTIRDYKRDFATITNVFGHMRFSEVTRSDLVFFRDAIAKKNKVGANQARAFFASLWSFALDKCFTDSENLAKQIKKVRVKFRDRYVTDLEFSSLCASADESLLYVLKFSLLLGQRPADICGIQVDQIDDDFIRIVQGKTGKALRIRRTGELADQVLSVFKYRDRVASKSLRFFVDENGQPMTKDKIRSRFDRARVKAGVDFRLVDLRAKAATDIGGIDAAQKLLGHNHQSTTRIYRRDKRGDIVEPLSRISVTGNEK
jgi:integrase